MSASRTSPAPPPARHPHRVIAPVILTASSLMQGTGETPALAGLAAAGSRSAIGLLVALQAAATVLLVALIVTAVRRAPTAVADR